MVGRVSLIKLTLRMAYWDEAQASQHRGTTGNTFVLLCSFVFRRLRSHKAARTAEPVSEQCQHLLQIPFLVSPLRHPQSP